MGTGEVVGLAVAAGVIGGAIGALPAVLISIRTKRSAAERIRKVEIYSRWLGAHKCVCRSAMSFAAASRALADQHCDSAYYALRCEEVQRARTKLCDAMQVLDLAEAELMVWRTAGHGHDDVALPGRLAAIELGRAINGDGSDLERLARQARDADRAAVEFVRSAFGGSGDRRAFSVRYLRRTLAGVAATVARWSKP